MSKLAQQKAFNVGVVMLVIGVVVGFAFNALLPSFAARPPKTSGGSGSCYVTPNPQSLSSTYAVTIYASGLPAATMVSYTIQDTKGASLGTAETDASGALSFSTQSTVLGKDTVSFTSGGRHPSTLATCTFSVQS